jgi:hypothetical protein
MPTTGDFTAANSITPGDSYFIRHTFTYLSFALFKHCGEILQTQIEQLEALQDADLQRMEAMEAQRVAMEQR